MGIELRQGESHVGFSARETCNGLNPCRTCPRLRHVAGRCILPRPRRQVRRCLQNVAVVSGFVGVYNLVAPEIGGGNTTVTVLRLPGN
jgi:hypothetical protein